MAKRGEVHNKIAVVLSSGQPVTVQEIQNIFAGTSIEPVLYRLSTYIWNIKKDGGIVKAIKEGRVVKAYQLVNADEFDKNGYWVGKVEHKEAA